MKKLIKFLKVTFYSSIIIGLVAVVFFYGDFAKTEIRTIVSTSTPEIVVKDAFDEKVKQYMESEDGEKVLKNWATQKALNDTQKDLDAIKANLIKEEASL